MGTLSRRNSGVVRKVHPHLDATCRTHAAGVLRSHGIAPSRVLSVDHDSVLFLSQRGEPQTGFFILKDAKVVAVETRVGFVVEP